MTPAEKKEDSLETIRTLLPHGHSEKTIALRADLLNPIFIYRMGRKSEKNYKTFCLPILNSC
jgi:hypothetical protein